MIQPADPPAQSVEVAVEQDPQTQVPRARRFTSLERRTSYFLAKAALTATELMDRALEQVGLRWRWYSVLVVISEIGPLSQQELVERSTLDRTSMVALIDHLEGLRLVERRRNPADRRSNAVHITSAGLDMLDRAAVLVDAAEEELFGTLSGEEREQLFEVLSCLVLGT